jgi:hypothetical protein
VEIDPNGKAMPWLWVVLLPFIDEHLLVENLNPLLANFDEASVERNRFLPAMIFTHVSNVPLSVVLEETQLKLAAGETGAAAEPEVKAEKVEEVEIMQTELVDSDDESKPAFGAAKVRNRRLTSLGPPSPSTTNSFSTGNIDVETDREEGAR